MNTVANWLLSHPYMTVAGSLGSLWPISWVLP